jgi:hypothetical protein
MNFFRRSPGSVLALCVLCGFSVSLFAQGGSDRGTSAGAQTDRAAAPDASAESSTSPSAPIPFNLDGWTMLAGTEEGLFALDGTGKRVSLWTGGPVRQILRLGGEDGPWAMAGGAGVLVSGDLQNWEPRNQGLPVKMIKLYQNGGKSFLPMVQEIKDLAVNPADPDSMVCATKDRIYFSRNQGRDWKSLGAPPYRTNGIKAAAIARMPAAGTDGELTVFLSHSTYGVFYVQPDRTGAQWIELNRGLEKLETTANADEVADIAAVADSGGTARIFVSQTFRRRVYQLDWEQKRFNLLWSDDAPFGTADSLNPGRRAVRFLMEGTAAEIDYPASAGASAVMRRRQDITRTVRSLAPELKPHCLVLRGAASGGELLTLSELWLLDEGGAENLSGEKLANNKEGLYLPVNHAMDSKSLAPYLDIISRRRLNMIVIDMKDDYGRLRFTPRNAAISEKGRVFRPLDIDAFLADMRSRRIYTVARVVVFKDPVLAAKEGGKYAVWDARQQKPWAGYHETRREKSAISDEDRRNNLLEFFPADDPQFETVRSYYDERWVDPYSEEVWEYTAAAAAELHERGFDEIQFDYIRFPTDGVNLADARYRWQENGMDMESAMLSFLRHIRARVRAPISIDIYGANGWYRTGARTGQEVEMLAPWVDVICPMYYPSHFEQDFLAQPPEELRPGRIYYLGTLRTARIGRGRVIVRPYVQAFFLNVAYDRKYYNVDYVRREVEGVRSAGSGGLTYWNNSGRYDDIPARD